MVELRIKMRTGETFVRRINGSIDDARQMISDRAFIELSYDDGFVVLNIQDVSLMSCTEVNEEQSSSGATANS
jgi:hypothetical protein